MEWYWWLLIITVLLILAYIFRNFLGALFWAIIVILAAFGLYVLIKNHTKKE